MFVKIGSRMIANHRASGPRTGNEAGALRPGEPPRRTPEVASAGDRTMRVPISLLVEIEQAIKKDTARKLKIPTN
jgi:hypothetical protein